MTIPIGLRLLLLFALMVALTGCSPKGNRPIPSPVRLPPGTTFEVFTVAAAESPDTISATDPNAAGAPLFLQTPAFLRTRDIATVSRSEVEVKTADGTPSGATTTILIVELTSGGSTKMAAATGASDGGRLAVVVNGEVISAPKISSQIQGTSFNVTGGSKPFMAAVEALTGP
jgi:preprotein translocase subunit SecD